MKKIKQIGAILGIIFIASLYLLSLITAIFAKEYAPGFFLASIFSTVVIPIMIYAFMIVYKRVHRNDFELEDSSEDTPKK